MTALEIISRDLDWREAELGSLKLLLARKDTTEHQRRVLLRACWAMLYAHYEGFSKFALTIFFDKAKDRVNNCGSLPQLTRLFALEAKLKKIKNLPSADFLVQVEAFLGTHHAARPVFPDVDTKSNLWPRVLKDLLDAADISVPALDKHEIRIKTLVSRRNNIAHGVNELISEVAYYREYENAVYELMYELAMEVDARLHRAPYA